MLHHGLAGGWNLIKVLQSLGIPKDKVLLPNPQDYRFGMAKKDLAAIYTSMDVLLAPSYGEGFGVPVIEAASCGTSASF